MTGVQLATLHTQNLELELHVKSFGPRGLPHLNEGTHSPGLAELLNGLSGPTQQLCNSCGPQRFHAATWTLKKDGQQSGPARSGIHVGSEPILEVQFDYILTG